MAENDGVISDEVREFLKEVNESLPGRMELELEGFYPRGVFVMKKGTSKDAVGSMRPKRIVRYIVRRKGILYRERAYPAVIPATNVSEVDREAMIRLLTK